MSQQDNFSGGFLLGAIVGGIAGGVLGAVLVSRRLGEVEESLLPEPAPPKIGKKARSLSASGRKDIEVARRSLEDKIAQLNEAIDDVRQQLGGMNGGVVEDVGGRSPTAKD